MSHSDGFLLVIYSNMQIVGVFANFKFNVDKMIQHPYIMADEIRESHFSYPSKNAERRDDDRIERLTTEIILQTLRKKPATPRDGTHSAAGLATLKARDRLWLLTQPGLGEAIS